MLMRIIIPTRGRKNQQLTLSMFNKELRMQTTLVCPRKEVFTLAGLNDEMDVEAQPDPDWTIAQKRKWIIEEWHRRGYEKILMFDDDLRFATRISDGDWHLREIRGNELANEIERLEEKLSPECPHVGFSQRQANQSVAEAGWKTPGKMCYSLGYYLPIVTQECELGRIETREDMDITLQLLKKGYPNAILTETTNDQRKYDAPGGATNERTIESSNRDAHKLAELHPGYVSVKERDYKASVPRTEVVCQWKKAYEDGLRSRGQK